MAESKKPSRRPPARGPKPARSAAARDPRVDTLPPPREEQATSATFEREHAPRVTKDQGRRLASMVPQLTELEADLSRERQERASEAALMGEMLVRVSQREAELAEVRARADRADERATTAATRIADLAGALDEARDQVAAQLRVIEELTARVADAERAAKGAKASARPAARESSTDPGPELAAAKAEDASRRVSELEAELAGVAASASQRIGALEAELTEAAKAAAQLDAASHRVGELEVELAGSKQDDGMRKRVEALEADLAEAVKAEARLASASQRIADLEAALTSATDANSEVVRAAQRISALEAELSDAESRVRAASAATDETSARLLAAEARASELVAKVKSAEDRARMCDEAARGASASAEGEARKVAELEARLRSADAAAIEAVHSNEAKEAELLGALEASDDAATKLKHALGELGVKLTAAEARAEENGRLHVEAQETASLVAEELTETEARLKSTKDALDARGHELELARHDAEQRLAEMNTDRARIVTLEGQLAQAAKAAEAHDSEVTALEIRHARAVEERARTVEQQIAAVQLQLTGAKNGLKDAERRFEEARARADAAGGALGAVEQRLRALEEGAEKAATVLEELERREHVVASLRARTLQQARDLIRGERPTMVGGIPTPAAMPVAMPSNAIGDESMDANWEEVISVEEGELIRSIPPPKRA